MANDKERDSGLASAEIGKYLDILAKDPNSRVFAPLAEAYRKAGLYDDAVEIALEGLKVHPNYLGGRVALGRAYFEKHQYAEAAAEMQKVAKSAPDNIIAHKVLGQIAYSQGDLPSAEKAFKMVLLLDPRDQEAQKFIADLAGGVVAVPPPQPPPAAPQPLPPIVVEPLPSPQVASTPPPSPQQPRSAPERQDALPLEEIQGIDDFDLQADDIFGAPDNPSASVAAPAVAALEEVGVDEPLDIARDTWLPDGESSAPEPAVAAPPPQKVQAAPAGGMELEVFSRVPWGMQAVREAPPPPVEAAAEESPFEVFGRPKRGGPPKSTKGEQTAFGEIDFEATAHESQPGEPEPATDSLFEVFTREPGHRTGPGQAKAELGAGGGARELEIETTAYSPLESFDAELDDSPPLSLDEELPRIDLTQEMELGAMDDAPPSLLSPAPGMGMVPGAAAEFELGPELELEPELEVGPEPEIARESVLDAEAEIAPEAEIEPEAELELEPEIEPEAELEPEPELDHGPARGMDLELDLTSDLEMQVIPSPAPVEALDMHQEITSVDLVEETRADILGDEDEEEPRGEPAGTPAGRNVFDTETLASIYVNQGFYGRAAEIYQRLIDQRPGDAGLRGKLEEVLALERGESGAEEPVAVPAPGVAPAVAPARPEYATAVRTGPEQMIRQLQTLLEAFKEGRPQ